VIGRIPFNNTNVAALTRGTGAAQPALRACVYTYTRKLTGIIFSVTAKCCIEMRYFNVFPWYKRAFHVTEKWNSRMRPQYDEKRRDAIKSIQMNKRRDFYRVISSKMLILSYITFIIQRSIFAPLIIRPLKWNYYIYWIMFINIYIHHIIKSIILLMQQQRL